MTRFVALAAFGNAGKAKALHALALVPAAGMEPDALTARPPGTTACPFTLPGPPKRPMDDGAEQACPTASTCAFPGAMSYFSLPAHLLW